MGNSASTLSKRNMIDLNNLIVTIIVKIIDNCSGTKPLNLSHMDYSPNVSLNMLYVFIEKKVNIIRDQGYQKYYYALVKVHSFIAAITKQFNKIRAHKYEQTLKMINKMLIKFNALNTNSFRVSDLKYDNCDMCVFHSYILNVITNKEYIIGDNDAKLMYQFALLYYVYLVGFNKTRLDALKNNILA